MPKMFIDEVHAQNVLQRMWEQSQSNEFCDVALLAGETEEMKISAHRSVLSASSEYFKLMFTPPFNESTAKEIKLPNVDGESLKSLVKFCYSGQLEMSEDTAEKLLITADSLLLDAVVNACGDFLAEHLHPTNCLGMANLAERHNCESLRRKAKYFSMEHFVELYESDEFLNLSVEQLTQFLSSDELHDPTEEHVFKSLMIWLEHERSERQQYKDEMLKLVRFPLIKPTFLIKNVLPVCTSHASLKLYTEAVNCHLMPELRTVNTREFTKPRRTDERLMAIRRAEDDKMEILYHCPQRLKWMKWLENLDSRIEFGVAVMEDDLLIVGGEVGNTQLNTAICVNLKTMNLKNVNPMNKCRGALGVAVINGFLYAVGGWHARSLNSVEKWDSKSNTWTMVASMSVSRYFHGITVFNGKIYVGGGIYDGRHLNSAECYDPQENVWTSVAPMCEIRNSLELAVANGMLYAVGGEGSKTIERYDHETNKWTIICSLCKEIVYRLCTTFNDKIILLYNNDVKEYNPATNEYEWKVNTSIAGLENVHYTFTFSGSFLESKFIEN